MGKFLGVSLGIFSIALFVPTALFAAESEAFEVRVSIAASASVSVSGGPINFGVKGVGSEAVSTTPIIITNNGSGSNQTYSLSVANNADWSAVTAAPGFNEYRISAAFNSDGNITWNPANHAFTTAAVAASAVKFAGNQTGTGVPYNEERKLYVKLETPSATNSPSAKIIPVTVTATVD